MFDELISVIVPIYNVEKYLNKCIDSIINQTYTNLEIILIDDGSTDNCPALCDSYMKKDSRIKVIHQNNRGLSSARNTGLDIATGSYIAFVDSDDYLEPTMYEELYNSLKKNDSSIAVCNFYNNKNDNKKISFKSKKNSEICFNKDEIFYNLYTNYRLMLTYMWNKLYKRNLFDNVRFPNGKVYEEGYVYCDIYNNTNKMSIIFKPLYNYVSRKNSIVNNFSIKSLDIIASYDVKIKFYIKYNYHQYILYEKNKKLTSLIKNIAKLKRYNIKSKEIKTKYYNELILTNKEVPFKYASKFNKIYKINRIFFIYFLVMLYYIRDIFN